MEFKRRKITDTKEIDLTLRIENNQVTADDYLQRAEINLKKKDLDAAASDLSKALELNKDAAVYFKRATIFHQINKLNEALSDYNSAIDINPDFENAYFCRAAVFLTMNDITKAEQDFKNVCRININRKNECVKILHAYKLKSELEKQAQIKKAQQEQINLFNKNIQDAKALFMKAQYTEAIPLYNEIIKLSPRYAEAYFLRGQCFWHLKNNDNAMKDFAIATALNPKYKNALITFGIAGFAGDLLNDLLK